MTVRQYRHGHRHDHDHAGQRQHPVADNESFTVAEGGTATEADLDVGTSLLDGDTDVDLPNDTLTVNTTPVVGAELRRPDAQRRRHVQLHARRQRELHRQLHLRSQRRGRRHRHGHGHDHDHAGQRQHPVADNESFTVPEGGTATEADLDVGTSLLDGDTDVDLPNDTLTVNTTPVVGASFGR